jgi:hypothetical protein
MDADCRSFRQNRNDETREPAQRAGRGEPSWGVGGQRLAPRLGRLHGVYVDFSALGVRNLNCSHADFSALGVQNLNCSRADFSALGVRNLSS